MRVFIRLTDALWVVLHAMQAVTNADSYAAIYKTRPDVKVRGCAWCVRDGWGTGRGRVVTGRQSAREGVWRVFAHDARRLALGLLAF